MNTKPFKGSNVFMSRNLVPPELFDTLHDALKLNGANVFLCCDPSRNSPSDFHVIASNHHVKFDDLRANGCNLLGPQCIMSCAKDRRGFPRSGYVCCLAMDGVRVLASGFDAGEKEKMEKLVIAMSGSFDTKPSSDVSFVIAKNVMAAKYKWAVSKGKHIVTINWLYQCWTEHRIVPLDSYRVPPLSGLIICVTGILGDERKEMQHLIVQNGGKYSAELTRSCTHLVCEVPDGDKFKVAQRWGNVHIVNRKWFDQSIARRVCLSEEVFPVDSSSTVRSKLVGQSSQGKRLRSSQSVISSTATDSSFQAAPSLGNKEYEDFVHSQNVSSADVSGFVNEEEAGVPSVTGINKELEHCVAADSETDDNDLYLSDCKICFVGFKSSDVRKLVSMVRKGGGSRYMSYSERMTHIVVGAPSDTEKRKLRGLAALGVIHIVKRNWLEDCYHGKKEVPVIQKHIASDILLRKDTAPLPCKASGFGLNSATQVECTGKLCNPPIRYTSEADGAETGIGMERSNEDKLNYNMYNSVTEELKRSSPSENPSTVEGEQTQPKRQFSDRSQLGKPSEPFAGKYFCFSHSFPEDQREEVVEWLKEGGGELVDSHPLTNVDFIVECHGVIPKSSSSSGSTYVSSHWIRSCLEDGRLLNVSSHMLYSPLSCKIPLPGFQGLRLCVSQYTVKERSLLRNLSFILGAKFTERLTKKVSHLLCKFATGEKYERACKWGVPSVRCEWLYECVNKSEVMALNDFFPEEVPQDPEAGVYTTQYPTQAAGLLSADISSQLSSQSQDLRKASCKRPRLLETGCRLNREDRMHKGSTALMTCKKAEDTGNKSPDVAAAIEDLLEQTSKIQGFTETVGTSPPTEQRIFSSDCPILSRDHTSPHSAFGPAAHCFRNLGKEDPENASKDSITGNPELFSETQTENQLVVYEEDLSGREMIIDRVRTQSLMW